MTQYIEYFIMSFFEKKPQYPTFGEEPPRLEWWYNLRSFIWETVKVIVISLAIIIPVRYFLIQPFYVQGASMEPNFFDKEYLIIDEISYRFNSPSRGEIVVFRYPRDPKQFFIKRIVGLPGEELEIRESQITIYNDAHPLGITLDETTYISDDVKTVGNLRVSLSEGEYYVMGDNRTSSLDSRGFGPIRGQAIVGRVWLRGWPIDRAAVIQMPELNF